MESKMKYHFLDDAHHSLVNHVSFSEDVNRHGYLFLYGKKKVSSFLGNPYSGHRSEFMSLEKDYLHSFKKRQPSRVTKASRQSDIGVGPKTQLSQILSVEPDTLFGLERNESEEDTNSILEIEETEVENVDYLHPKKVNKVKQVDSNIDKITLTGCEGKSSTHAVIPNDSTPLQDQESSSILSQSGKTYTDALTVFDREDRDPFAPSREYELAVLDNFKRKDNVRTLETLEEGAWLNDCAINYFLACLIISLPQENTIVLDSLLIDTLNEDTAKMMRVLESKLHGRNLKEMKSLDILVPLNVDKTHWILACVQPFKSKVKTYDSLQSSNLNKKHRNYVNEILSAADSIMLSHQNKHWVLLADLTEMRMDHVPQQSNGYDCGLYTCMFAKMVYQKNTMTFGGNFILSLRKFLYDHIRKGSPHFITFKEEIWDRQYENDEVPDYGKHI